MNPLFERLSSRKLLVAVGFGVYLLTQGAFQEAVILGSVYIVSEAVVDAMAGEEEEEG